MNCKTIFEAALALIGEPINDNSTADYAQRAVKLFFLVLAKYSKLSTAICGIDHKFFTLFITSLDTNFPLDQRTLPPVTFYLAALLIMDELPELSAMLEKEADQAERAIAKEGSVVGSTAEVY